MKRVSPVSHIGMVIKDKKHLIMMLRFSICITISLLGYMQDIQLNTTIWKMEHIQTQLMRKSIVLVVKIQRYLLLMMIRVEQKKICMNLI